MDNLFELKKKPIDIFFQHHYLPIINIQTLPESLSI